MTKPAQLTFFTELEKEPLSALFSKPGVVNQLVALKAGVSMGILDFSDERASVARRLNESGVPIVAWQLLPKDQGYWYHLNSADYAVERYRQFRNWSIEQNLGWDAIGIDIEPDINEFQELLRYNFRTLYSLIRRIWEKKQFADSCATYESLVARMHSDGYPVQSYEYFFMADERKTGSSLLTRLFGLAKVSTDKRVAMLYSSFFRPFGVGVLRIYGHTMDSAAIGITGGGVELEGLENKEPTNWEEFSRDLRIANIRVCWPVGPDHLTVLVSFSTDRGHRKKSAADLFTFPPVTTTVYRNSLIWIHPHTLNVARVHTRLPRGDNWLTPAVPSES